MKFNLLDLELEEVSLVDSPANKSATIALFKRDSNMDEEIKKALADTKAELDTAVAKAAEDATKLADLQTQVDTLTKALADKEDVAKAADTIEVDGEQIAKSLIPAPILKRLEEVAKAEELTALAKRADEVIPNVKGTAEQRGKLVKSIGDDAELLAILRAVDSMFEKSFKEIGEKGTSELLSATEKLDTMAKEKASADNTTFEKAYAAVIKTTEGKSLLKETRKA